MHFASLGSGSRGNGTLLRLGEVCVLVDCGFTVRQLQRRLEAAGLALEDLSAVLVTHEHSDHASGIGPLVRRTGVPVHATAGTWRGMRREPAAPDRVVHGDRPFRIGDLEILPVTVPHDAREPVQYRFSARGRSVGVLTDLGHPSRHVVERFRDCDGLLLEFNHEPDLLAASNYPPFLKRRVAGDFGHLSNTQSAQLLGSLAGARLQTLVAGHLSEQNNTQEHARAALAPMLGALETRSHIAVQDDFSGWFEVV
ncbi:MAG: MBL fold metallo-hydrolase [Gammaproteobacteria bacterium]|nr:MBL fold metallo-hydrolase [Gammaproteobacteria bacterium]